MSDSETASFERVTEIDLESPVLVEGLPGHGLVAAIAVDHLTNRLDLTHHGNVTSEAFPPAITYEEGLVHDLVRVYAGSEPGVLTLQSDLALPPDAYRPLARTVMTDMAEEFDRAIFLAGAPADEEVELGDLVGVATTPALREELSDAGIPLGRDPGVVGGVTGALVTECYHAGVPAVVLVVRSHPFLPDPRAAKAVIEDGLQPLVEFQVDTDELAEQADEIRERMQQIAEQYRQLSEESVSSEQDAASMFQ
jgi:uncharacterized protein